MSADLTYAYNYEWTTWARSAQSAKYERDGWERDSSNPREFGMTAFWLPHKIHDEPNVAFQGLFQWRRRINSVSKMTRSMLVVRDTKVPYVIIADDCEQLADAHGTEHEYTWAMAVTNDMNLRSFDGTDAVLSDDDDSGRSLVLRVLSSCRGAPLICELERYQKENKKKRLPDGSFEKLDASRLTFKTHSATACNFNIGMFPLTSADSSPPETIWLSQSKLEISFSSDDRQVLEYETFAGPSAETSIKVVETSTHTC